MKYLFIGLLFVCSTMLQAQEVELPLSTNVEIIKRHLKERSFPTRERAGGTLSLPFFDDFSRYSLPTDDPEIPDSWRMWEDDYVFLNADFPIEPPTIGVVTFDGLDRTGYPYEFVNTSAYGPADTLTSRPIDLSGLTSNSDVFLTFYYQPEGRGNDPEPMDSLVLEFYTPLNDGVWDHVWSIPGATLQDFEQVFIPITADQYLQNGFKFRFVNYATLSGNLDHWNLDYIFLDDDIDSLDFPAVDLAYMYRNTSLLKEYTSMPWTHFKSDPASFMLETTESEQRNLGPAANFISGYKVEYQEMSWERTTPPNTGGNGFSFITTSHDVNAGDNPFVYDTSVNDTCASFEVKFFHEESDFINQNDTAYFTQEFSRYYAYDDGTAERAYAVNVAGGKVAVQYDAAIPDTLLGLNIHFNAAGEDSEGEFFLLRIWDNNGGEPGDEIIEQFGFHTPMYYEDGYNVFTYYEFDAPVPVSGKFHVGWTQVTDAKLNVGNDKNTNSNPSKLKYQLGVGAPWVQSNITGSVMIRPVFKAGKNGPVSVEDFKPVSFKVYPNPTSEYVRLSLSDESKRFTIELADLNGKVWATESNISNGYSIDVSNLPSGIYILKAIDVVGGATYIEKVVKQ